IDSSFRCLSCEIRRVVTNANWHSLPPTSVCDARYRGHGAPDLLRRARPTSPVTGRTLSGSPGEVHEPRPRLIRHAPFRRGLDEAHVFAKNATGRFRSRDFPLRSPLCHVLVADLDLEFARDGIDHDAITVTDKSDWSPVLRF